MQALALNPLLRLGIVGLGRMGMRHWHTWQRLEGVELVAICDPDPAVQYWASQRQLPCFTDVEQLLDRIDIAVIASPSSTHSACAFTLLSRGIACLVEKPLALSSEECLRLALCAKSNNTLLAVGQCERFNLGVIRALRELNHLTASLQVFRHASHGAPADSDVIEDLLVHDLDWILSLGQQLRTAQVLASTQVAGCLQSINCRLDFTSGLQVSLSASYDTERRREVIFSPPSSAQSVSLEWQPTLKQADPLTLQAQAFLLALQGKPSPIATAEEALKVMQLAEQLREQALAVPADRGCCHA